MSLPLYKIPEYHHCLACNLWTTEALWHICLATSQQQPAKNKLQSDCTGLVYDLHPNPLALQDCHELLPLYAVKTMMHVIIVLRNNLILSKCKWGCNKWLFLLLTNLLVIFLINWLIILSIKYQTIVTNADQTFSRAHGVIFWLLVLCNCQNPKYIAAIVLHFLLEKKLFINYLFLSNFLNID